MVGDDHDVFLPFPQRRNHDLHDVQPIKQILAKPPLSDFLAEILLRRADQADIDVIVSLPPTRSNFRS